MAELVDLQLLELIVAFDFSDAGDQLRGQQAQCVGVHLVQLIGVFHVRHFRRSRLRMPQIRARFPT